MKSLLILFVLATAFAAGAAPKQVRVFVALCDNKTQGIAPVGERIGNGDDPDNNLYWGCSDGLGSYFRRSKKWKTTKSESDVSTEILRRMTLSHVGGKVELVAEAYRGSEIKQCLIDFEKASGSNDYDLVVYIGHNGLMDFQIPSPEPVAGNETEVVVLGCLSDSYFTGRLVKTGCKPILMTQQLMYPGSFILHSAIETWLDGGSLDDIRGAAGRAYARNQKISVRAATGVFAKPSKRQPQQGGADQPATAPESKSEGNEKPKPESEGHSR